MTDCIFCRIAKGEIPAAIVRQDADTVAFRDLNPQAPTHVLIIPRRHLATLLDAGPEDGPLLAKLTQAAAEVARDLGLADDGFRLVINTRESAGQSVFHLHVHLLGGRRMRWPPG
ncbi:MAG: histidine triad nucleotide-binding protein [Acidobacteriota bacterium]